MAGSQCCKNPPALSSFSGDGNVLDSFGGLKTYIAGSSDSKAAVLLISDVFGIQTIQFLSSRLFLASSIALYPIFFYGLRFWMMVGYFLDTWHAVGYEAPNLRKLADKTAAAGFFVVVPDFFHGDPYVPEKLPVTTWFVSHGTDKGFEDAKPVIAALKSKGFSAVGAAGFCWGAKVVSELAKADEIKAAVMLHPSSVTVDDIKAIKVHLAVLGAEIDHGSPPELLKQFEEVLSSNSEVDSFVKIFPGVEHGWTVRYDVDDEAAVQNAEEAHKDMIDWFTKHLK